MNTGQKNIFPELTKKSGTIEILEEELLDVLLDGDDLRLDLTSLVLGDAGGDHRPGHATSPTVKNTHVYVNKVLSDSTQHTFLMGILA